MSYDDILGSFSIVDVDDDIGPYLFLRAHAERRDLHLIRRELKRSAPRSVLPDRARLVRSVDADACFDVQVEIDNVLVLLRTWRSAGDVWATGRDAAQVLAVVAEIQSRMPDHATRAGSKWASPTRTPARAT